MAYQGKRLLKKPQRNKTHRLRTLGLICVLLVLLPVAIHGTIAFMQANDKTVNLFSVASSSLKIDETFDKNSKTNVTVKNTGDIPSYLRAALVISWKDDNGNILPAIPEAGTNYTLTMGSGWIQGDDGYWYYPHPVKAGASSPVLIKSCAPEGKGPTVVHLCVDILTQAVQAEPSDAVQELWGATVNSDGALTPKEVPTP
ncbi:hypothetical protein ACTQ4E_14425 [Lawsonibacter sp. LCP25S3_G6]|uniref:hypothetical protein n=1 Tax=unclassified Lawsonibacter TaxID=2617946 RepID=UPI003F9D639F